MSIDAQINRTAERIISQGASQYGSADLAQYLGGVAAALVNEVKAIGARAAESENSLVAEVEKTEAEPAQTVGVLDDCTVDDEYDDVAG